MKHILICIVLIGILSGCNSNSSSKHNKNTQSEHDDNSTHDKERGNKNPENEDPKNQNDKDDKDDFLYDGNCCPPFKLDLINLDNKIPSIDDVTKFYKSIFIYEPNFLRSGKTYNFFKQFLPNHNLSVVNNISKCIHPMILGYGLRNKLDVQNEVHYEFLERSGYNGALFYGKIKTNGLFKFDNTNFDELFNFFSDDKNNVEKRIEDLLYQALTINSELVDYSEEGGIITYTFSGISNDESQAPLFKVINLMFKIDMFQKNLKVYYVIKTNIDYTDLENNENSFRKFFNALNKTKILFPFG